MTLLYPAIDLWTGLTACKYSNEYGYNRGCRCSECKKAKNDNHTKRREEVREIFDQIRDSECCLDCGYDKIPAILEFHHLTDHEDDHNPRDMDSIRNMVRELRKGVFLCPTCHRIRHLNPETGLVNTGNSNLR